MRVSLDVFMIVLEDRSQEFVFGRMDGLDDEAIVPTKVEERPRLARRTQLGKYVLCRQR